MPFSVGIGDVIAVGKLIKDITDSLRSAGGAKSEYQELTKELEALKAALDGLDQLDSSTTPSALLDTIKFVAADCRQRLEVFWAKIERYESSLGPASRSNALRGARDKLGWTFCRKEEVVQLQRNVQCYSNAISILMIRHVAGQVQDISKNTDAVCTQIAEGIIDTQGMLADVGKDVSSQGAVASNIQTLVTGLHQFIFGDVKSFLADFGQLVNKVFASTQQIYAVVLEIRDSRRAVDTRWAFFQDPFVVEDAFGRKFPIPSDFNLYLMDQYIRHRFKEGHGSQDVALGNYELLRSKQRSSIITPFSQLLPGTAIVMVVIVRADKEKLCPMPRCTSVQALPCPGGGFTCSKCEVWFDQGTKKRQELELVDSEVGERPSIMNDSFMSDTVQPPNCSVFDIRDRRPHVGYEHELSFKNVKIAVPDESFWSWSMDDIAQPSDWDLPNSKTDGCSVPMRRF